MTARNYSALANGDERVARATTRRQVEAKLVGWSIEEEDDDDSSSYSPAALVCHGGGEAA